MEGRRNCECRARQLQEPRDEREVAMEQNHKLRVETGDQVTTAIE